MRSQPTDQILAALQQSVTTALKQWLDDNKNEVLLAVGDPNTQKTPGHGTAIPDDCQME